jgi:hypothetical protein
MNAMNSAPRSFALPRAQDAASGPLTTALAAQPGSVLSSAAAPEESAILHAGMEAMGAQIVAGDRPEASVSVVPFADDVGLVDSGASASQRAKPEAPRATSQAPSTSPIRFLESQDQGDPTTRFMASSRSLTASFEEHSIRLQLGEQDPGFVRLAFEGASTESRLVGERPANGGGSYDAAFGSVRYTGLYDGIDMRVGEAGGELQYELFVAPGADVAEIMIRAEGGGVKVAADGSLTIQTPGGTLHQTAPVSWEVLPGGVQRPVESHFRVVGESIYGFEVVGHDPSLPLVIDPTLTPAPTLVSPANGASVTVPFTVSWSAVASNPSGVVAYNWQVSTASTFTTVIWQDSTNSPTTQDIVSGLANGTYFWRVQAVNGAFEQGAWSATRSFTVTGVGADSPGTPVLAPPQAYNTFHPFETGSTWWNAVPGAATYVFETSRGDPNFAVANTFKNDNIDQTTVSFTLGFEGNFFSRVYAVSADGIRGVPSNVISYSYFFNNPVGPPPTLLSPINGETLTLPVTLQWAHVPNPQVFGYDIEIARDASFSNIELVGTQQHFPSVPIRDLTPGTKFWRVFSNQGDDAPATVNSPGSPAVTAPSATGTFTISAAPSRPVSVALEGVDQPQAVTGGTNPFVALQLSAGVPASGTTINLTSSNPSVAPVPATITMPGTHAWTNFQIALGRVTTPTPVTITATLNGVSTSGQFTVLPAALKSLQITAPAISGGSQGVAWVNLTGPAPVGGAVVSLSSSSPAAGVPSSVIVPAGAWSQSVPVMTTAVTDATSATITASLNGASTSAKITVTPPRPPASLTIDPISRIGSDPGTATVRVTIASYSAYDQTFQLTSSNPAVVSVPSSVTVPAGSLQAGFPISTSNVAATTTVTIAASGAGVTKSAQFSVFPNGTAPSLSTVRLDSASVMGGTALSGTVNLNSMAPAGGLVVTLSSSSPAVTVPASVTVRAGAISATFPVTTSSVTADTTVTISGTRGTTQSTTLTVTSGPTGPSLSSVSVDRFSVVGGNAATGTVFLNAAAPPGGAVVTLSAESPAVTVPASVTVPADAVAVTFPVTTSTVTAPTAVSITGSFGGRLGFGRLTVTPPPTGPVLAAVTVSPTSVVGLSSATATVTLSGPAPAGGAEVVVTHASLALAEDLLGIIVTVPAGATSATFPVDTYKVSVPMVASIRGTFGGVTQAAVLTVNPTTAPTLSALSINPASVVGGNSSTGTVTLSAAAPAGGLVVTLSDNSAAVTVPASVTVAAGATSASFTITTTSVTAPTSATISATAGGVTRSATLTVNPVPATVSVSGVSLNPTSVTGGNTSQGTVTLSGPAPSGGLVVTLSDNSAAVTVPASVTVAAGATSANFTVTTSVVTASTSVLVSATGGGVTRSATLAVTPPQADTVAVTQAEYRASKRELRVNATSTSGSAVLRAYVTSTGALIGTLTNDGGGRYSGRFSWPTNPQNITVRSSLGGSAGRAVRLK